MEKSLVIIFIGSLFFLAHAFVLLFEKTKVPDILYLIIIGLIIGPVLHLTQPEDFGKVGPLFSTIALVVILFEGGLELNIESMRESLGETFKLIAATYFSTTLLLGSFFFFALNYDLLTASFIAAVVAGPAPVVVLPLLKQLKPSAKIKTTLTIEAGLGEALAIMVSLAIFESIKMKDINGGKMIGNIISSFILAAAIGLIAGYFWSIILNKIRQLRNAIFTTPSFVFVIYGLCEFLGFSGPIGVLVFGATLCNTGLFHVPFLSERIKISPIGHNETEKLFFGEIVFVLKTFFFVYLGLSISFQNIFYISIAAITIVIIFGSRYISVKLLYAGSQYSKSDLSTVWLMISKGLAAAVLGSLLFEHGIERGGEIRSIIYYIILLSIIANSFLIFISQRRNTVVEKK